MSSFARSSQINFIGWPSPSSWMITGHSSCDIHNGSGLAAVSCVRRSPSRIWRTRRREQPKAVAISRRLRPSARRRLISSCLSTVNTLRAIQLSRSCSATTVLDCGVSGPKPGFSADRGKRTAADGPGATIGEDPDRSYRGKLTNLCWHRRSAPGAWRRSKKHVTQGRKAAPAGGPIGAKSGGSITPKSGGPIQTKSGGSNHSKSCTEGSIEGLRALPVQCRVPRHTVCGLASTAYHLGRAQSRTNHAERQRYFSPKRGTDFQDDRGSASN